MADGTISFFLEKLTNLAIQEAALFGEVEGQISLLRNELPWMLLFLRQASVNRTSDERLRLWVDQMRDVCYDAEDVVDDFMFRIDHVRQQRLNSFNCLRPLPLCIGFGDKLLLVHDLKARLENINMTVEKILVNKTRYGIENPKDLETWSFTKEEDLPPVHKVGVVPDQNVEEDDGMQYHVESVKPMLFDGRVKKVVSIVGMGGLGKTTLARRVYNDSDVVQRFRCRAWVTISQEYRISELLMRIANSIMCVTLGQKHQVKESELGEMLRDFLESKTYLIVLDDLWSPKLWDDLSSYFLSSRRSRVLITTRSPQVHLSSTDSDHEVYKLLPLDCHEGWELFLKKVFRVTTREYIIGPSISREMKNAVAHKCQGSPLSIALLGGLLSRKQKTPESWNQALERIKQCGDDQPFYLSVLSWSYKDLPYYLKSCFLYCGLFPQAGEIDARKLMALWIAEGFIPKMGEETLEEAAEDCLEELIQRSLIQVGKRGSDGGVKSCYIHDMVRDFNISEARNNKFFEVCKKIHLTTPLRPRRLSFHRHVVNSNTSQRLNSSRLRSLLCFSIECREQKSLDSLIRGTKLLAVLDLEGLRGINELPRKIGQLIHLKYLGLRRSSIARLPKSVGKLVNLQTLDLRDSPIGRIPHTIWKLRQLRQLYVGSVEMVLSFSMGDGLLTNPRFKLEHLSFSDHSYLHRLFLTGVLNKLPKETKFYPPNLMELRLSHCALEEDPMPILQALPNLRNLQLSFSYEGRDMTFSSHGFLQLESLTLSGLWVLEQLNLQEGALPGLRFLKIKWCTKIKGLLHELLHLKIFQRVKLKGINPELTEEFKITEGEKFHRICSITSIIQV